MLLPGVPDAFLDRLKTRGDVLAVILFGSRARGDHRPDSDVDLLVLLRERASRRVEVHDGVSFEVLHETEESARAFWEANPSDAAAFWQVARVLFDRDGTGERLRVLGRRLLETRPPPPSPERVAHLRFDAEDVLRAAESLARTDPATASLLLHAKVAEVAALSFEFRRAWSPPPKRRLTVLRAEDPVLAAAVERFLLADSPEKRLAAARRVVDRVLPPAAAERPSGPADRGRGGAEAP